MTYISAKTWSRFFTTNFSVASDVMGSAHEFQFETFHVTVRLPDPERADEGRRFDEVATASSYRGNTNEIISYSVIKVDVEITVPKPISVPEEALSKPPKQIEFFSEKQKKAADDVCDEHSALAQRAFQYWLEMIRWASGNALIGQPYVSGLESGWSTYLLDSSTNHQVWAGTVLHTVYFDREVTSEQWELAAKHLQSGDELPLHLRFLHDAKTSTRNRQYEKAIIETAMACEIYLRYAVFEFIPEGAPEQIVQYIEEANTNRYASQFFKGLLDESQKREYRKVAAGISSLMSRRNTYLHMGRMDGADNQLCQRFIKTAEKLFTIKLGSSK